MKRLVLTSIIAILLSPTSYGSCWQALSQAIGIQRIPFVQHPVPKSSREIIAEYDAEGVYVYQAYSNEIADAAIRDGKFSTGYKFDRGTWIKPSLEWMLYRSGYASKIHQERILRIKISHDTFQWILQNAVPSTFDSSLFPSIADWIRASSRRHIRYQWDPGRDLKIHRTPWRAIQIGIPKTLIHSFNDKWILSIEDVTSFAHNIKTSVDSGADLSTIQLPAPQRIYEVSQDIQKNLGMTEESNP